MSWTDDKFTTYTDMEWTHMLIVKSNCEVNPTYEIKSKNKECGASTPALKTFHGLTIGACEKKCVQEDACKLFGFF